MGLVALRTASAAGRRPRRPGSTGRPQHPVERVDRALKPIDRARARAAHHPAPPTDPDRTAPSTTGLLAPPLEHLSRTLAELPWGEYAVTLHLSVRRLFCDNAQCERCLFAERLPGIAAPWSRKRTRLAGRLTAMGLALGGAGGMCLGRKLGLNASRNTLLRLVRAGRG